ncbi:MAG: hypothetical protein J6K77_07065 [Ruminococcus sp.]|nr:hypothetical protein [Ruminococcus sp.]
MIKNETYLRRGWSFTHADIVDENDDLMLYWYVGGRFYKSTFRGFSYDDTIPILYKTKKPKRSILCDEKYWRSKMRRRCIATALWGIFFFPLFIRLFF